MADTPKDLEELGKSAEAATEKIEKADRAMEALARTSNRLRDSLTGVDRFVQQTARAFAGIEERTRSVSMSYADMVEKMEQVAQDSNRMRSSLLGMNSTTKQTIDLESLRNASLDTSIRNTNRMFAALVESTEAKQAEIASIEEELGLLDQSTRARSEFAEALDGVTRSTIMSTKETDAAKTMLELLGGTLGGRKNGVNALSQILSKQIEKLAEEYPRLTVALKSTTAGFRAVASVMRGIVSIGSSIIGIVANIGTALIRLPFRLISRLQEDLTESFSRFDMLRKATQDLRGDLGNLTQGAGASALRIAKEFAQASGAFTRSNLAIQGSLESLFGHFEDATVAMQQAAASLIGDFGGLFYRFRGDIEGSAQELFMFQQGLGLSGESLQAFAREAQLGGRTVVEELNQLNISVQSASQTFGISSRDIAADVARMRADFTRFGGVATQELVNTSIYLRRMGLEIQDVAGLLDGFDNFESVADSAAALAQGLGMNVDAMELFMADDPADRLEVLRRSFVETGRSFDDLTRRERAYLAQHTNLSQETLSLALSQSGLAMSMGDVYDAQEQAADSTLTEAQAMRELADSIKLMVDRSQSMTGSGGVLGAITSGFSELFIRSGAIVEIQRNFEGLILSASRFGRQLAELLTNQPLVNEFFGTIARIFDPARWTTFFDGTLNNLDTFFAEFESGDSGALSRLIGRMVDDAGTLLSPGNAIYQSLVGTFRQLFVAGFEQISVAFGHAKPYFFDILDGTVSYVSEWWETRGKDQMTPLAQSVGIGLGGVFVTAAFGNAVMAVAPGMIARGLMSVFSSTAVTGAAASAGTATGSGFVSSMGAALANPLVAGAVAAAAAGLAGLAGRSFRERHAEAVAELEEELGRDWNRLRGGRLATVVGGIADFFGADGEQWFRDTIRWAETLGPLVRGLLGLADSLIITAEGLGSMFKGVWDIMQGFRESIWSVLTLDFDGFVGGIRRAFGGFGNIFGGLLTVVRSVFSAFVSLGENIGNVFGALWVKVSDFWSNTEFSFNGLITFVYGLGRRLFDASLSFVGSFIDGIKEGLGINSPPKRIIEIFDLVVDTIEGIIGGVGDIITYPFRKAWSVVRGVFGFGEDSEEGGVASTFAMIRQGVSAGLEGFANMIREPFRHGWGMVKNLFGFGDGTEGREGLTVASLFQSIKDTISEAVGSIADIILAPFRAARDGIASLVGGEDGILSGIGSAFSGLSGVVTSGPSALLGGIADTASGLLGSIIPGREQMAEFTSVLTNPLEGLIGGLGESVQTAFTRSFDAGILSGVRRISSEYASIDQVLSRGLPAISLSGTLRRFNDAVTLARETITMDVAPININVTLNVSLDAEQLVYSLSDEMLPARLARDI